MPPHHIISRRRALAAGAGVAGAAVLAACSSGSNGARAERTAAASSGPGPSGPATSPAVDASSAAPAAGPPLATLAELTIGESVARELPDGKPVLMTRTSQTTVVCFSAICTHEGCTVKPDGAELACPCHGSTFAAGTGTVLGGPAPAPLHAVDVTVIGGQVLPA